jgi:putative ABC transport system permease protein
MKYFHLIWKNMTRKKARATFTFFSVIIAFTLYGMLTALAGLFSGEMRFSADDRLFVTAKNGGFLPISYVDRIRNVDGIVSERLVWGSGIGVYYQDEQQMFGAQPRDAASTVKSLQAGDRYIYNLEELENWATTRNGILVQKRLADEYDLQVGDNFPLIAPGVKKEDGTNLWEFVVMGIYSYSNPDENPREAFFHYDYFDEARLENKGTVGYIVNIIADPDQAERIGQEIDAMFANSSYETQTGTEDSLTRDFFRRVGNMGFAIYLILGAVFLTMVLVTANTMIQAFKERVHEIGILKTLGFTGPAVLGLILAEALLILFIGGAIGLTIAWYIIEYAKVEVTELFYLGPADIAIGFGIIVIVGLVVGGVPALQAKRLTITQALGRS